MRRAALFAFVVLLLMPGIAWAGAPLRLGDGAQTHPLGPYLDILQDDSGRLGLADIRAGGDAIIFRPLGGQRRNLGMAASVYWLRFRIEGERKNAERWLLELAAPILDDVRVYFVAPEGVVSEQRAGDMLAFAERPYRHRNLVFPLPAGDFPALDVYLRVASEGAVILPLTLWTERAFLQQDNEQVMWLGAYFGILAVLLLYNLFLFAAVRDRSYLYYVLYLGGTAALQFALLGFAARYLWPAAHGAGNPAVLVFMGGAAAAGAAFARSFLGTRHGQPRLHRLFGVIGVAGALMALGGILVPYVVALRGLMLVALAIVILVAIAGVRAYRQGYRPARFLLLAFAALVPGILLYMARAAGWAPSNPLTDHAIEIGTALEALLLSFGLADRISAMERELRSMERRATETQATFSQALIRSQERDRRRIAGELHDSIGQALLVIHGRLRRLAGRGGRPPEDTRILNGISEITRQAVEETRAIARFLHPPQLERLGLAAAMRTMAERALSATDIALDCEVDEAAGEGLEADDRIHLYRIAQEAVSNVVRHAGARHCRIRLRRNSHHIELRVEDDGSGPEEPEPGGNLGFGMAGLHERARLLGGVLVVEPAPQKGTRLVAIVPVARAAA